MSSPKTHNRYLAHTHRAWRMLRAVALTTILALCLLPLFVRDYTKAKNPSHQVATNQPAEQARLSENVSVHASGRGNPLISLSDGRELLTAYVGPEDLSAALAQNRAEPLSLASADFDEDGVPDLVSGYAYNERGIVTLLRGNVDAIYPHSSC